MDALSQTIKEIKVMRVCFSFIFTFGLLLHIPAMMDQQKRPDAMGVKSGVANADPLVTDRSSDARAKGLPHKDQKILENAHPRAITTFDGDSRSDRPLALVLLLDSKRWTSGHIGKIPASLAPVLMRLKPEDKVAVIDYSFWRSYQILQPLTVDRSRVIEALTVAAEHVKHPRKEKRKEKTDSDDYLNKALFAGLHLLQENETQMRSVIVVFTEDFNVLQNTEASAAARQLVESGVVVNGIVKL
ncbi:MAG: hypothetical protein ACRD63_16315, partial [Pyrinomonadaceae bacterium]